MAGIASPDDTPTGWDAVMGRAAQLCAQAGVDPARAVLIVPSLSLAPLARTAWARVHASSPSLGLPALHTWQSWANSLQPWCPDEDDFRGDVAHDSLIALRWLRRSGLAALAHDLAPGLLDLVAQLGSCARGQAAVQRLDWAQRKVRDLGLGADDPVFGPDASLQRLAVTWAGNSSYDTDALHNAQPALLLVLDDAPQWQPLLAALRTRWGQRCAQLDWPVGDVASSPELHGCNDAEDEAQRAAACVLHWLAAGRAPVALVAQDRVLVRRIAALLQTQGVRLHDAAGWKLSTTRAAASLHTLLRLATPELSADAVLDWLTHARAVPGTEGQALHAVLMRQRWRRWDDVPPDAAWSTVHALIDAVRSALSGRAPLRGWMQRLRQALHDTGQWQDLVEDAAGAQIVALLRMGEAEDATWVQQAEPWTLSELRRWINQALEQTNFRPPLQGDPQVVVLGPAQLRGHALGAVVWPGCDERRMTVAPLSGRWTAAQRQTLGLPDSTQLRARLQRDWDDALALPRVSVLVRRSEDGEPLLPGLPLARWLAQRPGVSEAVDPRVDVTLTHVALPCGVAHAGILQTPVISASAYSKLRHCPYQYFALQLLRLRAADELDDEVDKAEFGSWVHAVLHTFHERLRVDPAAHDDAVRRSLMQQAEDATTQGSAWPIAEFVSWEATWRVMREAYLAWLPEHEAAGAAYLTGEQSREVEVNGWRLRGRVDRIDRAATAGGAPSRLLLDYKTESLSVTQKRTGDAAEDVQLAFYALLEPDVPRVAYLNLSRDKVTPCELADPPVWAAQLRDGLVHDLQRVAANASLRAIGAGKTCEFCDARGLCRRDFWEQTP